MYPNLLHLAHISIPTFGVLAAIGVMAALAMSARSARTVALPSDEVWNAGVFAVLATFVLSRLILIAENFATFRRFPVLLLRVPSLTPLGLLLAAVATLLYLRVRGLPLLATLDAWSPCATTLWIFLAIGHFAEGSDPGLPSRFGLPVSPGSSDRVHPVALYAALMALVMTAGLWYRLRAPHRTGDIAAHTLLGVGFVQFVLSFLREPFLYMHPGAHLLDPIQWVALGMIAAAGVLFALPGRPAGRSSHAF